MIWKFTSYLFDVFSSIKSIKS